MTKLMSILAGMMLLVPSGSHAATLYAGYAGGNGNDGVMFNLASTSGFLLQSFDIHADFGTFDYRVYHHAGGVDAAIADPAAWTLIGSFDALTTAGEGIGTTLDLTDLLLSAGTHGFYITDGGAFSVRYSNSSEAPGTALASSGPVTLQVGYGADAFGGIVPSRAFNGSVTFAAVPEPAAWAILTIGFGAAGGALRRRRGQAALRAA